MEGLLIASSVAAIIQTIAVIVSLRLIRKQIEQQTNQVEQQTKQLELQTKLATVANTQALFELSSVLNLQVIQDKETAELIYNGHREYESFDDVKKFRYRGTLTWRLAFQRLIYFQHKNGLLDESTYEGWEKDFKAFIQRRQLGLRWPELKSLYTPEFGDYVSKMIETVKLEPSQNALLNE